MFDNSGSFGVSPVMLHYDHRSYIYIYILPTSATASTTDHHAHEWHGIAAHRLSGSLSVLPYAVLWLVLIVVSTDYLIVSGLYWGRGKEKAHGVNCLKRCWSALLLRIVGRYYVKKESETRVSEICSKRCEGDFCNRSSCFCSMLWCMVSHEYVSWWVGGNLHVV